ncbi:hypothetical protein ABID42_002575 [Arcicella rosea]|uniref:hypothetical protein n=1 Tax=Arcicella rosea TaxID=502909 RepID=UPI00345E0099
MSHPEFSPKIASFRRFKSFLDLFSSLLFVLIQKVTAAAAAKKSRIPNRSGEPTRFAQTVGIRCPSITKKRSKN